MPYKSNKSLPAPARHALTKHGQTAYRKAYNAASKQYKDPKTAYKVAWSAARKSGGKKKTP